MKGYADTAEVASASIQALAAGKHGAPEVLANGSRKATGTITLSGQPSANDTITVNGVVFTFKASGATGNQINIGGTQAITVDNIQTALGSSVVAAVAKATYTDDNTAVITVTYNDYGVAGNSFTLAENAANLVVSGATLTGGCEANNLSVGTETSSISTTSGGNSDFFLPDAEEGQEKTIYFAAKGGSSNAVVNGTFYSSNVKFTMTAATQFIMLKWLGGVWRVASNPSSLTFA